MTRGDGINRLTDRRQIRFTSTFCRRKESRHDQCGAPLIQADLLSEQTGPPLRSKKAGETSNFNELRFEDEEGAEQVFLRAERNFEVVVKNDSSHTAGRNASLVVGADRKLSVVRSESIAIGANQTTTIKADQSISVGLNMRQSIGGNQISNVGTSRTVNFGNVDNLHVGRKLLIEAGELITLKVGSASIILKKDGLVTINGTSFDVGVSGAIALKGAKILQS